jgi:hypothetical protein
MANVVGKPGVSGKAKFVGNGDLPVESAVIDAFEFEMIYRIHLVAEVFQGAE